MYLIDGKTSNWVLIVCALFLIFVLGCALRGVCCVCDFFSCIYKFLRCLCRCCGCCSKENEGANDRQQLVREKA